MEITANIKLKLEGFKEYVRDFPSKKVLYLIWKNPYMAVGKNTFIDELLQINNFENIIIKKNSRYPEVSIELIKTAELVLLSTEPYPFKKVDANVLAEELNSEVKLVDGEFFSWYGSRLIKAFEYFKELH